MNEAREIRESIRKISGFGDIGNSLFTAEVIDTSETSCTIELGEMKLKDVRLFSVEAAGKLLLKPKIGSKVTVADLSMGALRDLQVIKADEVELIRFSQDNLVIEIDSVSKKVDVSNPTTSLTKLFTALYDIISKLTVSTPNGPSGTPLPPTITSLEKFKTDFQKLLK